MDAAVVVPLRKRIPNRVDVLFAEVHKVQSKCKHDFKLIKPLKLEVSKIANVYIGETQQEDSWEAARFTVRCLKCSVEETRRITKTCPRCLGNMKKGQIQNRVKYHGERLGYNASRPYSCKSCGFNAVLDEYDQ